MICPIPFYIDCWQQYDIPAVTQNSYGMDFPEGTSQLAIELWCFNRSRELDPPKTIGTTYEHCLRIIQMLWTKEFSGGKDHVILHRVVTGKNGKKYKIFNDYFFKALRLLCSGRNICLTGPASAAKTYTCAIYALICFWSSPSDTTVLISTTSGAASERRIWKDIKKLYNRASFDIWGMNKIGAIIDYLKCLTYDEGKEMSSDGKGKSQRELSNGVLVIPIPADSKAEGALDTIMGTKNEKVIWIVDELPAMKEGIDSPRDNLEVNPVFQFVGIGNANRKSDPHGDLCEPKCGWDQLTESARIWEAATCIVLFLHGEESPNDHPIIEELKVKDKRAYPFPFLSNALARFRIANRAGRGNIEIGKNSINYLRFAIGFWFGDSISQTILSGATIRKHNADQPATYWNHAGSRAIAGFDPAFTAGGDNNSLTIVHVGRDIHGQSQVAMEPESFVINPMVKGDEEYRYAVAEQVVKICKEKGVQPKDFYMDGSNDGSLMAKAINDVWKTNEINVVSSLGTATRPDRYKDRVTELWYQILDIISMGVMRDFNTNSAYARDLFSRKYVSLSKDMVQVEKKKDMRKRIHRSPDDGDSFCYAMEGVIRSGAIIVTQLTENLESDKAVEERRALGFDPDDWKGHNVAQFDADFAYRDDFIDESSAA